MVNSNFLNVSKDFWLNVLPKKLISSSLFLTLNKFSETLFTSLIIIFVAQSATKSGLLSRYFFKSFISGLTLSNVCFKTERSSSQSETGFCSKSLWNLFLLSSVFLLAFKSSSFIVLYSSLSSAYSSFCACNFSLLSSTFKILSFSWLLICRNLKLEVFKLFNSSLFSYFKLYDSIALSMVDLRSVLSHGFER